MFDFYLLDIGLLIMMHFHFFWAKRYQPMFLHGFNLLFIVHFKGFMFLGGGCPDNQTRIVVIVFFPQQGQTSGL